MTYERTVKFTKWILNIMYYSGMVITITLPYTLKFAGEYYSKIIAYNYIPMLFTLLPAAFMALMIIFQLRKMMKTVIEGNCFVQQNVISLEAMSVMSVFISGIFAIKMILMPTPATFIIIIVFFVAALFSLVLSYVFRDAINYKEENDLTI